MSEDRFALREATETDRPALETFMARLQDFERETEPNRTPGEEMAASHLAWLLAWAAEHPGGGCLVAEDAQGPCGFVLWGVEGEPGTYVPEETRTHGVISDLWIEERARGRGLAARLIRAAEARLRAAGIERAELSAIAGNTRALRLYRQLGYADYAVTLARRL